MLNEMMIALTDDGSYVAKCIVIHKEEFKYDEQEGKFVANIGVEMPEIDTAFFKNVKVNIKGTKVYLWLEVL